MTTVSEKLRSGCITKTNRWSGDTHSDSPNGSVDVDATDALMWEAADTIERLENEVTACEVRMDNDKLELARAYDALKAHTAITGKANAQAQEFERKWFLACDERDAYQQSADKMAAERDALSLRLQDVVNTFANEIDTFRAELAEAEQDLTEATQVIENFQHSEQTLRAELEKLKQQEPYAWATASEIRSAEQFGGSFNAWHKKYNADTPLYLAAGAQAVPEGYQLVPIEPTDAMVQAALHLDLSYMPLQEGYDRAAVYKAMLEADGKSCAQTMRKEDAS